MDEHSLVLAHARALGQQLKWAEASLQTAAITPRIREAAANGFAVLFEQRRTELKLLEEIASLGGASANAWKQLARTRSLCKELFGECLRFLGSALMRSDPKNSDDICDIADALLYEVDKKLAKVKWDGVTLLADGNFFTEDTGLIRLPFPDYGIWNLPISVHELGHFAGPRILDQQGNAPFQVRLQLKRQQNPFMDAAEQLSDGEIEQHESHLKELFSDLFAVYALGPAYACSCILLNFTPVDESACEDNDTHPSHAKRVHFILEALAQMDETDKRKPYERIREELKELWERNLRAVGLAECLDEADKQPLNQLLFELYTILNTHQSTVMYKGWESAMELTDRLLSDDSSATVLTPAHTIADVLNAAWFWRLSQTKEIVHQVYRAQVSGSKWCREIMRQRAQHTE